MPAPHVTSRRFAAELLIGSAFVLAGLTVISFGVVGWAFSVLPAAYPCGETYRVHPACRLAHPEAIRFGYLLMMGVPALCAVAGVVVGVLTFVRWRVAILPTALAFGIALAAYLTGQTMLASALHDIVPW